MQKLEMLARLWDEYDGLRAKCLKLEAENAEISLAYSKRLKQYLRLEAQLKKPVKKIEYTNALGEVVDEKIL